MSIPRMCAGAATCNPTSDVMKLGRSGKTTDFQGREESELHFKEGEKIQVLQKETDFENWYYGENETKERGFFPANYVRID